MLPLAMLSIDGQLLTTECLAHLGACTRITWLSLNQSTFAPGATPMHIAAALSSMTGLRELSFRFMSDCQQGVMGWGNVLQAASRLPSLSICMLDGNPLHGAELAQLGPAPQLTQLVLSRSEADDAAVVALCSSLVGLRELDVCTTDGLTDACRAAIAAAQPRKLTRLHLGTWGRTITDGAVQQLSSVLLWLVVS